MTLLPEEKMSKERKQRCKEEEILATRKRRGGGGRIKEMKRKRKKNIDGKRGKKITNELQIRHVEKYRLKKANSRK